jgi:hypothetical protein
MDEGCTQPLSSDPMINLNTTVFFFAYLFFPFARNLHKLEPLALTTKITVKHKSKDGKQHTQIRSNTHAHKPRLELKMKHNEFTTRTELKSLTQSIKCAETECGRLRMLKVCLGDSSMRLGVPFIAPRQLGAVGGILGRIILPSVGWRTGQSDAPSDSHCSYPVRDLLPFLAHPTIADSWQLAHRTLFGAHRTVWCPLPTVGAPTRRAKIARPTVGSPDSPVHHRTVR